MAPKQIDHAIAPLAQSKASVKAIATLLGVFRSTIYTHVPQLGAIRAKARTATGWQLSHQRHLARRDKVIPVDDYPSGSARLRRTILATQAAAATVITDLTGQAIDVWDEDGVGDPCWTALLIQTAGAEGQAALDATLARLSPDRRPTPPTLEKYDQCSVPLAERALDHPLLSVVWAGSYRHLLRDAIHASKTEVGRVITSSEALGKWW